MHVERELKLKLDPRALPRVWRLLPTAAPARRRQIESVYYDTPDLRL